MSGGYCRPPPKNALYNTMQMVMVDSCDELIICLLWLLKGGKQNYWYNKYIYLCLPPFKSHRKQIISLSQVSTRTICTVWYSAFLGGRPTIAPRQFLIYFFAWFDFLTSISTHLVQRIWILGCYYQSWKIHQFNNNRLTVRLTWGQDWDKL